MAKMMILKKLLKKKEQMPLPVTMNDCKLLHQMGYNTIYRDGRVDALERTIKKKHGRCLGVEGRLLVPLECPDCKATKKAREE